MLERHERKQCRHKGIERSIGIQNILPLLLAFSIDHSEFFSRNMFFHRYLILIIVVGQCESGVNESNVDTIDTCVQYSWSGIPVEKLSDCLEKSKASSFPELWNRSTATLKISTPLFSWISCYTKVIPIVAMTATGRGGALQLSSSVPQGKVILKVSQEGKSKF